jgi:filamentous hemagglutinin family protein
MLKALFTWLGLSLCTLGYLGTTNNPVLAQVTSDGTINTQVTENGNTAEITEGETRGDNLFHSFQDFSVRTGNEAFFNNADSISNIFSRVTGGNVSDIDGAIRANGSANLFLINPAGIVFGENASLNIGGSFYGSSASSILFEDGEFSAADLDNPPLLTVNAPIGLGFRDQPGDIVNRSTANGVGLQVFSGKTISLIGGDVSFNGGRVTAPGGIINLGGLSTAGEISIDANNSLSFADEVAQSNVSLSNNAVADVTSDGGGLISVNANNLELTGESLFLANIGEGLGSENSVAGTIEVSGNSFSADNKSLIHSDNLGTGKAGTININTDILKLTDGSAITATTFGVGDAGTINVTAQNTTLDQEFTGIYSNVGLTNIASESKELNVEGVVGNGGEINVDTNTLSLTNGARIISTSIAQGNGGTININATGAVSFTGQGNTLIPAFGDTPVISGSFSQVQQDTGNGNAGKVNISAESLTLIDKGAVLTDNSGVGGDAGDITLDIQNNIFLDQTGLILAQVQLGAEGNGGDINITAGSLEAQGNSFILADTKGIGDAGNINIEIEDTLSLDETSVILTEVGEDAVGNAGDITITADSLIVTNGANIAAQTKGQGDAGNISITTNDNFSVEDSGEIRSLVETGATGKGGDVSLTAGNLNLTNQSQIIADTTGQSLNEGEISTAAGDISIDVSGDINLDNNSKIQSQTRDGAVGSAGDITIDTGGSLFSTNGNLILADSKAQGNGGNIKITAGEQIVLEGLPEGGFPSQIVAGLSSENAKGTGGNIVIKASELVLQDVAFISSNTVSDSIGSPGNINIDVNRLQLTENAFINALTSNDSDAGKITINAQTLDLFSGGKIIAATNAQGDAGNISLNIGKQINIDTSVNPSARSIDFDSDSQLLNELQSSFSGIYADATENARGSGGNVFIDSNSLSLNGGATISASTNSGKGGNLTIDSNFIVAFPNQNNDIIANAEQGAGGNIAINAESVFGIEERSLNDSTNDINASSEFDLDGTININTSKIDPLQGTTELPSNVVEAKQTTEQTCSANREGKANNGLAIAGRGGVTPSPDAPLNSENISNENPPQASIPEPIETAQGKIQLARGIKVTKDGRIILTAYRTNNAGERIPEIKPNCN